jgi:putative transcriptional regulator
MSKRVFDDMMAGLKEAASIAKGEADPRTYRIHVPHALDVRAIRKKLGLTQAEFASQFSLNIARLRDWEQKRSHPDAALRAYLLVIARKPEAVKEALQAA